MTEMASDAGADRPKRGRLYEWAFGLPTAARLGLLLVLLLAVVLLATAVVDAVRGATGRAEAQGLCENAVRWQLDAPGGAKFGPMTLHGDGPYRINSYVEAANRLGVPQRLPFECRFTSDYQLSGTTVG